MSGASGVDLHAVRGVGSGHAAPASPLEAYRTCPEARASAERPRVSVSFGFPGSTRGVCVYGRWMCHVRAPDELRGEAPVALASERRPRALLLRVVPFCQLV